MVPALSIKVSRVSMYSGSCSVISLFAYGAFTLSGWLSQNHSAKIDEILNAVRTPKRTRLGLASFGFARRYSRNRCFFLFLRVLRCFSSRVPFLTLWIGVRITGVFPVRFPHSDIHGSQVICTSPWLFAAYHVFHRLLVPRHPPCALLCLTSRCIALQHFVLLKKFFSVFTEFLVC